jgi:hypothetical protein
MARRLNWQKRAFDFKPKRAFKDEEEFRKADWGGAVHLARRTEPVGASLRPPQGNLGGAAAKLVSSSRQNSPFAAKFAHCLS